ncbi:lipoprotein [Nitrospira sp. KM1]|uniref:DUF3313 domain-containing protein n=1 Tax=Nitrospira sp. KM1 TaxID=1936990 RepID=UPI0013A77830|nr:DUF3313 domain-containing protein [Nitrospira sp. KM1]BCA54500.1 lipoprotein [Nitrospira sp. KM1]
MIRIQTTILIVLLSFAGGCSSTYEAKHVQPSGFLKAYHAQLNARSVGSGIRDYKNPDVDWSSYRKVILRPVHIWEGFSSQLPQDQREELQKLADSLHDTLYLKLFRDFEVVEQPAPDTMLIQVAITHAEKSWVAPALLSKVSLELQVLNTIWTYFSGKPAFAGEVTVEFTAQDSQTGALLVAGADRRVGGQNLFDREVLNSWGDAKNSLHFWSDLSAYRFCRLQSRAGCVEPKA